MTPAEVRAVVERVVAEHGQGWRLSSNRVNRTTVTAPISGAKLLVSYDGDSVWPSFVDVSFDQDCARAVALWPEMQRLASMLREALNG